MSIYQSHHIIPKHIYPKIYGSKKGMNNPENLIKVTVAEHATWHYELWVYYGWWEDWLAWKALSGQIGKAEIRIELVKLMTHQKIENGTHNFLKEGFQSYYSKLQVENGNHPFQGSGLQNSRVAAGTHNFVGGAIVKETNRKRLENGTHHLLGGEQQKKVNKKRIEDGSHNFLGPEINQKRLIDGTHHFLNGEKTSLSMKKSIEKGTHQSQIEYLCPHCGKIGKGNSMKQHHFDNCKYLRIANIEGST